MLRLVLPAVHPVQEVVFEARLAVGRPLESHADMPLVMSNALADAIFWIAVASCTVAQVAILRSIFNTSPQGAPTATPGAPRIHRAMEIVWAILPAIALAGVLLLTWRAMQSERAAHVGHSTHPVAP